MSSMKVSSKILVIFACCQNCNGHGRLLVDQDRYEDCPQCSGKGYSPGELERHRLHI